MTEKPIVALVDDDADVLDSLQSLLSRRGLSPVALGSAAELLERIDAGEVFECIVTDIRMPGTSGVELYQDLKRRHVATPVIFITGHGEVDLAVRSMKAGVTDFIEKPIDGPRLVASIKDAVERQRHVRKAEAMLASLRERFAVLSERQREVMLLVVAGHPNKEIAARLKLSIRTVEHYREWVMEKMQAKSIAELVQMAIRLDLLAENASSDRA